MKKIKNVIGIYVRVLAEHKGQTGQEIQRREGKRIAKELFGKDIEIKLYVDEGLGRQSHAERNRMLEDVKHSRLEAVITYKAFYLSHSITHALRIVEELHKSNVCFYSIVEGEYTPQHLNKNFKVLKLVSQLEREEHSHRIRQGIAFKKQKEGVKNEC